MNKRFLFIILILLFQLSTSAQNWAPFTADEKFHFSNSGDQVITNTIHVDSVYPGNASTFYYLNRVIAPCDTCEATDYGLDEYNCPDNSCLYLKDQGQFLNLEVVESPGGMWTFIGHEDFTLFPLVGVGSSWNFDGTQNAQVSSASTQVIFGVTDSVKNITVDDGQEFLLSKEHGLLRYYDPNEEEQLFDLVGIQGRDVGVLVPEFHEIFDFEVGDVFEYRSQGHGGTGGQSSHFKRTIHESEQFDDSISVAYNEIGLTFNGSYTYAYSLNEEEWFYKEDYTHFEQGVRTGGSVDQIVNSNYSDQLYSPVLSVENSRIIIQFGVHIEQDAEPSQILDFQNPYGHVFFPMDDTVLFRYPIISEYNDQNGWPVTERGESYGVGLGKVSSLHYESLAYGAFWNIGYVKQSDTTGIISPDSLFSEDLIDNLLEHTIEFNISPNPAESSFEIIGSPLKDLSIEILDTQGRVIHSEMTGYFSGIRAIDCSNWPVGVYLVKWRARQKEIVQRLVIH